MYPGPIRVNLNGGPRSSGSRRRLHPLTEPRPGATPVADQCVRLRCLRGHLVRNATSPHLLVDGIVASTWTRLLSVPGRFPEVILHQLQPFGIVDEPILIAGSAERSRNDLHPGARRRHLLAPSFVQGGAMPMATFPGQLSGAVPPALTGRVRCSPPRLTRKTPRCRIRLFQWSSDEPSTIPFRPQPQMVVSGDALRACPRSSARRS